jgi:hypothetical protein
VLSAVGSHMMGGCFSLYDTRGCLSSIGPLWMGMGALRTRTNTSQLKAQTFGRFGIVVLVFVGLVFVGSVLVGLVFV